MAVAPPPLLERVEAEVYRDLYAAAPLSAAASLGLGMGRVRGAEARVASGAPAHKLLNHVLVDGEPLGIVQLERLYARVGARYVVGVPPELPRVRARLEEHGLVERGWWAKMVRRVGDVPMFETDYDVSVVAQPHAPAVGALIAEAFELPASAGPMFAALVGRRGWTCHVALEGGAPVAAGMLRVTGSVAWLGFGATRPDKRNRGAQSALLATRLAAAAVAGCRTATLEAPSARDGSPGRSWRNAERAGFEVSYLRANLVR